MSDLDKLIEAVEDGAADDFGAVKPGWPIYRGYAESAYNGSLDAAKALHDSLLPAYRFRIEDCHVSVWYGHNVPFLAMSEAYKSPARAWLIAILKAYKSQQEKNQ